MWSTAERAETAEFSWVHAKKLGELGVLCGEP